MKEPSATDSNNNSLIVEDEERATSSGVETIIATEESSSFNATAVDRAAAPKRKTTNKFYIAVGSLVVAAGVSGIASFAGSSIHSSKQQVVAALMNEKVKGYEFVANGECRAEGGKYYDYIVFADDITGPQDCGERCSGCPGNNNAGLVFLGFTYGGSVCECHVDDIGSDVATEETLFGACEDVAFASAGHSGKGEIQGANGDPAFVCYKKSEGGKSKSSKRGKSKSSKGNVNWGIGGGGRNGK